jgi:hypothetical protein
MCDVRYTQAVQGIRPPGAVLKAAAAGACSIFDIMRIPLKALAGFCAHPRPCLF